MMLIVTVSYSTVRLDDDDDLDVDNFATFYYHWW